MTRYEITTKPGVILDATLVKKVVTAKPKTKPAIIVYINKDDMKAFEKMLEGNVQVLEYHCDPRAPGTICKEWKRT
jgi:hypothetical protein